MQFFEEAIPFINQPLMLNDFSLERGGVLLSHRLFAQVNAREVWQIGGVNGAGKTTLLMALAGLKSVDADQLSWSALPSKEWSTCYVSVRAGINQTLTVLENLSFLVGLSGLQQTNNPKSKHVQLLDAIAEVGLSGYEHEPVRQLSSGQKRRVALARLWMDTQPALWLLDEPFTALDVAMTEKLNARIRSYADAGGRVMMTSHQPVSGVDFTLMIERVKHNHTLFNAEDLEDVGLRDLDTATSGEGV